MGNALNRSIVVTLKNKSGGAVAKGDVVVVDSTTGEAFTTSSTIGLSTDTIGVVIDPNGIANNENGLIAVGGTVPQINLISGSALGDTFGISSTPKYALPHAIINAGDFGQVLGTGTTPSALLWGMPSQGGTTGSAVITMGLDGWIAAADTWVAGAADAPSYTYSIANNVTGTYGLGMRVKWTQTSTRMAIITKVDYSAPNTNITIYGGTDYTMATGTAITSPYYSSMKAPFGFPLNPDKWSVEFLSTGTVSQAPPTANVWYNLGSYAITIPVGLWNVSYSVELYGVATNALAQTHSTLSTANNSQVDLYMTSSVYAGASAAGTYTVVGTVYRRKIYNLLAKTIHYLNAMSSATITSINFFSSSGGAIIRAECAYL